MGEIEKSWEEAYNSFPGFLFSFGSDNTITRVNHEMATRLKLTPLEIIGQPLESLLSAGSKIFLQTHLIPLLKMKGECREIFLQFKSQSEVVPVLLNMEGTLRGTELECLVVGLEISNRSQFEKELIMAKKTAEEALEKNEQLISLKNDLLNKNLAIETQYRSLNILKEQQQELFKLISHDLQEPLRKSIIYSDFILSKYTGLEEDVERGLARIASFNEQMVGMLKALQKFERLYEIKAGVDSIHLDNALTTAWKNTGMENNPEIEINLPSQDFKLTTNKRWLIELFKELFEISASYKDLTKDLLTINISASKIVRNVYVAVKEEYHYEEFIKISYKDDGLGFFGNSFRSFSILDKSIRPDKVNLGLAYCKQIVEKLFGHMEASTNEDSAPEILFYIPLRSNFMTEPSA